MIERQDPLLSPKEAGEYMNVTRQAVYKWIAAGKIETLRAGGALRIRQSELDAWLETPRKRKQA